MTRIRGIRNTFTGGIISPETYGNVDIEQYNNSLQDCVNMLKQPAGGLFKRNGTTFIKDLPISTNAEKLIPYIVSAEVSFLIRVVSASDTSITLNLISINKDLTIGTASVTVSDLKDFTDNDLTKTLYVQNKESLLIFVGLNIVKVEVKDDAGEFNLSAEKINYTVPPLGLALSSKIGIYFPDRGDAKSDAGLDIGVFVKKNKDVDDWIKGGKNATAPWTQSVGNNEYWKFANWFNSNIGAAINNVKLDNADMEYLTKFFSGFQKDGTKLDDNTRIAVTYSSMDAARPTLTWLLKIVSASINVDLPQFIVFEYERVREYCPQGEVTNTDTKTDELNMMDFPVFDSSAASSTDASPKRYNNTRMPAMIKINAANTVDGYFKALAPFEGRLYMASTKSEPNMIVASSRTFQDWLNFMIGSSAGDGMIENVASNIGQVFINWLVGSQKLFTGTSDGIYVFGSPSSSIDEAITPTNARAKKISSVTTSTLQPLMAMDSVFFTDASTQKIYEIVINENSGMYSVNEMTMLSRHLFTSGVKSHAYMQIPMRLYFACLNNGTLISISYLKNIGSLAVTRNILGTFENNYRVEINNIYSLNKGKLNIIVLDVIRYMDGKPMSRSLEALNYDLKYDPASLRKYYVDCGFEQIEAYDLVNIKPGSTAVLKFQFDDNQFSQYQAFCSTVRIETNATGFNYIKDKDLYYSFENTNNDYKLSLYSNQERDYFRNQDFDINGIVANEVSAVFSVPLNMFLANIGSITFEKIAGTNTYRMELVSNIGFTISNPTKCYIKNSGLIDNSGTSLNNRACKWELIGDKYVLKTEDSAIRFNENNIKFALETVISMVLPLKQLNGDNLICTAAEDATLKASKTLEADKSYFVINMEEIPEINQCKINIKVNKSFEIERKDSEGEYYWTNPGIKVIGDISVNGFLYKIFNKFEADDVPAPLRGKKVYVMLNHNWYEATVDNEGTVTVIGTELGTNYYWYMAIGLRYPAKIETAPFYMASPVVGSTLGLVTSQQNAVLQLYNSIGGKVGTSFDKMYNIPYREQKNEKKPITPETEMIHCSLELDHDVYQQRICLEHNDPTSFNVLSITQDVNVSDGV